MRTAQPHRRSTIWFLTLALIVPLALPASADGAFIDDDGSIHEVDIDFIASLGITLGCNPPDNDEYCPDDYVTRAQMASFLRRAFNLPAGTPDRFVDDDGSVHEADIDAIAERGITLGCNPPANTEYCPEDFVTREQMATFIVRGLRATPFNAPVFEDALRGATHTRDINALAGLGITLGCNPPDNTLYCPTRLVTRAEMASFLARMVRLGDARPPGVEIVTPPDLDTIVTQPDPDTNQFVAEVTFTADITGEGSAIASFRWDSTVGGFIGNGNPLDATLAIPTGQTSSQPHISVLVTDVNGLFSGHEIQLKLIMPSP